MPCNRSAARQTPNFGRKGLVVGTHAKPSRKPEIRGHPDEVHNEAVGPVRAGSASVADAEPPFRHGRLPRTVEDDPYPVQRTLGKALPGLRREACAVCRDPLGAKNQVPPVPYLQHAALRQAAKVLRRENRDVQMRPKRPVLRAQRGVLGLETRYLGLELAYVRDPRAEHYVLRAHGRTPEAYLSSPAKSFSTLIPVKPYPAIIEPTASPWPSPISKNTAPPGLSRLSASAR